MFGSSTEAVWKDNPQGALHPYCVCRNVIDATKRYGITYTTFQMFDQYRLRVGRYSGFFPGGTEYPFEQMLEDIIIILMVIQLSIHIGTNIGEFMNQDGEEMVN